MTKPARPPRRWCADCGTYVGERWAPRVLCRRCLRLLGSQAGWTREARAKYADPGDAPAEPRSEGDR